MDVASSVDTEEEVPVRALKPGTPDGGWPDKDPRQAVGRSHEPLGLHLARPIGSGGTVVLVRARVIPDATHHSRRCNDRARNRHIALHYGQQVRDAGHVGVVVRNAPAVEVRSRRQVKYMGGANRREDLTQSIQIGDIGGDPYISIARLTRRDDVSVHDRDPSMPVRGHEIDPNEARPSNDEDAGACDPGGIVWARLERVSDHAYRKPRIAEPPRSAPLASA